MNRVSLYRILAVVLPVVGLVIGGLVAYQQYMRHRSLTEDDKHLQRRVAMLQAEEQALAADEGPTRVPTVPVSANEQPAFLNLLRAYAAADGVKIVSWKSALPSGRPAAEGTPDLPKGVIAVPSSVEAVGPYQGVRRLLYHLARAPRMLTVDDLKWTRDRGTGDTSLTFTLTRYVSPAPGAG